MFISLIQDALSVGILFIKPPELFHDDKQEPQNEPHNHKQCDILILELLAYTFFALFFIFQIDLVEVIGSGLVDLYLPSSP